jgi:endonuclease YncB( thermonuclease family)
MPPGRSMSDEQRRAMFARMRGGGGSHSGGSSSGESWSQNADGTLSFPDDMSWMDREARGISGAESDFLIAGLPGAGGLMSALGRAGKALASWKTPILSALGASGLDSYRENHPTLDPKTDHYLALGQQVLEYVTAISGLAAAKGTAGKELGRWDITVQSAAGTTTRTAAELLAAPFQKLGSWMGDLGSAIGSKVPGPIQKPLDWLYKAYSNVADFTGSSLADVGNIGKNRTSLRLADEMRMQAALIETRAGVLSSADKTYALDLLDRAHQLALTKSSNASTLYGQAADLYRQSVAGAASSKLTADRMRRFADGMTADARLGLLKAATVGAGFVAKEGYDEWKISGMQEEAAQAFHEGREWGIDPAQPRSGFETAVAIAAGTLGNPIEKQFRYGQDSYQASVAAYRAKYAAIQDAAKRDGWTPEQTDVALTKLASEKPRNMAGKAAWTFAPASAAFLAWKGGEYADRVKATGPAGTVTKVRDADTIEINNDPTGIRWLGINAPEIDHGPGKPAEYMGPQAGDWQRKELLGKTVRLVYTHDKGGPLVEKDIYGRDLAYIETLPRPFDKLLAIPGLGKLIPAQDQNLKSIEAGMALPKQAHERLQGGKHDRRYVYDAAAAKAIASHVGLNDRAANTNGLPEVPEYVPFAERKKQDAEKRGYSIPDTPQSNLSTTLGLGLMTTGQSGVFKHMGPAGNIAAQAWNALLAVGGARDYNRQAEQNPVPRKTRTPRGVRSEAERDADRILERYTRVH